MDKQQRARVIHTLERAEKIGRIGSITIAITGMVIVTWCVVQRMLGK